MFGTNYAFNIPRLFYQRIFERSLLLDLNEIVPSFSDSEKKALSWIVDQKIFNSKDHFDFKNHLSSNGRLIFSDELINKIPTNYRQEKKNEIIAHYMANCFNQSFLFSKLERFHQFFFENSFTPFDEFCLRFIIGQGVLIPTESLIWKSKSPLKVISEQDVDNFLKLADILCLAPNKPTSVEFLWSDEDVAECTDQVLRKLLDGLIKHEIQIVKCPWLSIDSKKRLNDLFPSKIAVISGEVSRDVYKPSEVGGKEDSDYVYIAHNNSSEYLKDEENLSVLQKKDNDLNQEIIEALDEQKDELNLIKKSNIKFKKENKFLISNKYFFLKINKETGQKSSFIKYIGSDFIQLRQSIDDGNQYNALDLTLFNGIDESNIEDLELFINQLALMQIRTIYINQDSSQNFRLIFNIIQRNGLPIKLKIINSIEDLAEIQLRDLNQIDNLEVDFNKFLDQQSPLAGLRSSNIEEDIPHTTTEIDPEQEISLEYEQEQEKEQEKEQEQNSEEDDFTSDNKQMPIVRRNQIVPIKLTDVAIGKKEALLFETDATYGLDLSEFMLARQKKIHYLLQKGQAVKICTPLVSEATGGVGKIKKYIGLKASPQAIQSSYGTTFYERLINLSRQSTAEVLTEKNLHLRKVEALHRRKEILDEPRLSDISEDLNNNLNNTIKNIDINFFPPDYRAALAPMIDSSQSAIINTWETIKTIAELNKDNPQFEIALFYLATLPVKHPLNLARLMKDPDINFSSGIPNFIDQLNSFSKDFPFSSDEQIYLSLKICSKKSFFSSNPYFIEKGENEIEDQKRLITIKDLVSSVEGTGLKFLINDFNIHGEQNSDLRTNALSSLRKDPCSANAFENGRQLLRLTVNHNFQSLKLNLDEVETQLVQKGSSEDLYIAAKNNLKAIFIDQKFNLFHEIIDKIFSKDRVNIRKLSDSTDFPKHFLIKYAQSYLEDLEEIEDVTIKGELLHTLKAYEKLYETINKSVKEGKFNYKSLPKLHRYLFPEKPEGSFQLQQQFLRAKIQMLHKLFPLMEDVELLDQLHSMNFSLMNLTKLGNMVKKFKDKKDQVIFLMIIKDFNQQTIDKKLTVSQRLKIYENLTPLVEIYKTHHEEYGQQSYKRNYITRINSALINNLFVKEKEFEDDLTLYSETLKKIYNIKNDNPRFYVDIYQSIHSSKKYTKKFWNKFLDINHEEFNLSFKTPKKEWETIIKDEEKFHANFALESIQNKSLIDQKHYARFFKDDHLEFGAVEAGLQGLSQIEKENLALSLSRYNHILEDDWFKSASIQDLKNRFYRNKEIISKLDPSTSAYQDILLESLAIVSYVVAQTSTFGFAPQATQQISVLLKLINPRQIQQIATGEGKTLTSAVHSIMEYLKGRPVEYITSSESLAQQSFEKMSPLFSLLDIPHRRIVSNSDKSLENGITISDINRRVLTSLEHQENPRDLAKNSSFIIDEVDYLLNDLTTEFKIPQLIQSFEQIPDLKEFYEKVDSFSVTLTTSENEQAHQLRSFLKNQYRADRSAVSCIHRMPLFILKDLINAKKTASQMTLLDEKGELIHDGKIFSSIPNLGAPLPEYYARPLIEGEMQFGSNFALHVQQLLHIKLNKRYPDRIYPIQYPSDIYASHRVDTFFKYALTEGHMVGLTGTVGTIDERNSVEDRYPGIQYYRIPSYLESKRTDQGKVECASEEAHLEYVENKVQEYIDQGRPIYIVTENDTKKTQYWFNALKKLGQPIQIWDARGRSENGVDFEPADDTQFSKMRNFAAKSPNISIVTVGMGGRGVDLLAVDSEGMSAEKGLGVCIVDDIPARAFNQAVGRTGRQGKEGISCQIINKNHDQKIFPTSKISSLELKISRQVRDAYDYLVNHPLGIISNWPEFVKRVKKAQIEFNSATISDKEVEIKINTIFEEIFKIKLVKPKEIVPSVRLTDKSLNFINHHHLTSVYSITENAVEEPLKTVMVMTPLAYSFLSNDRKKEIESDSTRKLIVLDESELKGLSQITNLEDLEKFSFNSIKSLRNKVNQDTEFHIIMGDISDKKNPFNFLENFSQIFLQSIQNILETQPSNIHMWHHMNNEKLNDSIYCLDLDSIMFEHKIADTAIQTDLAVSYALDQDINYRSDILCIGKHKKMKRSFVHQEDEGYLLGVVEDKIELTQNRKPRFTEKEQKLQKYLFTGPHEYLADVTVADITEFLSIFSINKEIKERLIFSSLDDFNQKIDETDQFLIRSINSHSLPKFLDENHPCIKKLIQILNSDDQKITASLLDAMNLNNDLLTTLLINHVSIFPKILAAGFEPKITFSHQYSLKAKELMKSFGLDQLEILKDINIEEITKSSGNLKKIIKNILKRNPSLRNGILDFILNSRMMLPILLNVFKLYLTLKAFFSLSYESYLYFKSVKKSLKYAKENILEDDSKNKDETVEELSIQQKSQHNTDEYKHILRSQEFITLSQNPIPDPSKNKQKSDHENLDDALKDPEKPVSKNTDNSIS